MDSSPTNWIDPYGLEKLNLSNISPSNPGEIISNDAFARYPDVDGVLLIQAHGNSKLVGDDRYGSRKILDASGLANVIRNSGVWKPDMDIVLFSCETGKGKNSIGEQLAKNLGVYVTAPTKFWRFNSYNLSKSWNYGLTIWSRYSFPRLTTDLDDPGEMRTFGPDGFVGNTQLCDCGVAQ